MTLETRLYHVMGYQQYVADSVYFILGGEEKVCPIISETGMVCVGIIFTIMVMVIHSVNRNARAKIASVQVCLQMLLLQSPVNFA